jgi:catechol 2,3-dioxygenase-like lactoylglutathione lyase family enzyme
MRFLEVTLRASSERLDALFDFYGRALELPAAIGETTLRFEPGDGAPFYHFALLVPGDRFDAALEWARARTELLPDRESGDVVFDFDAWDAQACYFEDPAGNIVELIAHRGVDENGADGEFRAAELVGLSELGLVGDPPALAAQLAVLGIELWDGTLDEPGRLAFLGEPARTLILSPPGRGWLPTGRPAEPHPVVALVRAQREGKVQLDGSRYRIEAIR